MNHIPTHLGYSFNLNLLNVRIVIQELSKKLYEGIKRNITTKQSFYLL